MNTSPYPIHPKSPQITVRMSQVLQLLFVGGRLLSEFFLSSGCDQHSDPPVHELKIRGIGPEKKSETAETTSHHPILEVLI